MSLSPDLIGIVETAYAPHESDHAWLEALARAALPSLDAGFGVTAMLLPGEVPNRQPHEYPFAIAGMTRELEAAMLLASSEDSIIVPLARALSRPVNSARTELGADYDRCMTGSRHVEPFGVMDVVTISGWNPGDPTFALMFGTDRPTRPSPQFTRRWSRVAAHLASAARLRQHALSADLSDAPAVMTPSGDIEHLRDASSSAAARATLRDATRAMGRARGSLRRTAPDEALASWTSLVDGTYALVETTDTDGRRFVVAHENLPRTRAQPTLTARESQVIAYRAVGHSLKLIGYELGLSAATVSRCVASAMTKLGVDTQIELARACRPPPSRSGIAPSSEALAKLTDSEASVALMLLRGLSQKEIAAVRRSAPRTVANQVASIYDKLAISSRAELAARFA